MNCQNCGAPMTLVGGREYWVCPYCHSFYFPEATEEGLRILGGGADVNCPVCDALLVQASMEGTRLLTCQACHGVLIQQTGFVHLVQWFRAHPIPHAPPGLSGDRPAPLNRDELNRHRACPRCGLTMDAHPYLGGGNVVIDTCGPCAIIWLDAGELQRIAAAQGNV